MEIHIEDSGFGKLADFDFVRLEVLLGNSNLFVGRDISTGPGPGDRSAKERDEGVSGEHLVFRSAEKWRGIQGSETKVRSSVSH